MRRRGPRPGRRQRGNEPTYDPTSGYPYRATLTFARTKKPIVLQEARERGVAAARLMIDLVTQMQVDENGRPLWATAKNIADQIVDESMEELKAAPGPRYRVAVDFPPAQAAKLVRAANALDLTVAEVMRCELRRMARLRVCRFGVPMQRHHYPFPVGSGAAA